MLRDAAEPIYEHFALSNLNRLPEADIQRLIEVHRSAPFGPHPDDLARVLNVFRARETVGKFLIMAMPGDTGYRLAKITGERVKGSVALEPDIYPSIEDAEHAVFVARLRESNVDAGVAK